MNLREMYEHRKGKANFRERDAIVKVFEAYYQNRNPKTNETTISYRPELIDPGISQQPNDQFAVNLSRRVISHFGATFARPPKLWKSPLGDDHKTADNHTAWLQQVMAQSRIKTLHPRQAHWLSMRGDAVFGVDWNKDKKQVLIRTYDPAWCYPQFSNLDLGEVDDMLIAFSVPTEWAKTTYGVTIPGETCHVYIYWDHQVRRVQVDNTEIGSMDRQHDLGFCPFRWVFGSPDGSLAQADVRDLPPLQDLYNENLSLALDAIRKQVDPSYYGTGLKGNLVPEPGTVVSIPNENAKIAVFPSGGDPAIIMGVMSMLEQNIEATSGISPISSHGQAGGSIVTGSAVRHQVEAIEARVESRRAMLEDAYAQVGEYSLRVLEKIFEKEELSFPTKTGEETIKGADVDGWYTCFAQYGDYLGLSPTERVQASLQGLGRIYDDHMAIRLADLPDTTPEEMVARIADYQERQAVSTGRGQALGQLAAQEAQQNAPSPDKLGSAPPSVPPEAAPQKPGPPPTPGVAGMNVTLEDVTRALKMVETRLKGPVWATGDLAIVGMSASPMVVVGLSRDLPIVNSIMQSLHGMAVADVPKEMPRLELV
jgi:hypothetical protein